MKYLISLTAVLLFIGVGCVSEKQELLDIKPIGFVCDTVEVSYQMDVVPIMENNCYRCHNNVNSNNLGAGIAFETYEDIQIWSGTIVEAIKHAPGASNMPKGSAKLDDCTISIIESWVLQGMKDN